MGDISSSDFSLRVGASWAGGLSCLGFVVLLLVIFLAPIFLCEWVQAGAGGFLPFGFVLGWFFLPFGFCFFTFGAIFSSYFSLGAGASWGGWFVLLGFCCFAFGDISSSDFSLRAGASWAGGVSCSLQAGAAG